MVGSGGGATDAFFVLHPDTGRKRFSKSQFKSIFLVVYSHGVVESYVFLVL